MIVYLAEITPALHESGGTGSSAPPAGSEGGHDGSPVSEAAAFPDKLGFHVHGVKPPTGLLHFGTVAHMARHHDDPTRAFTPLPAYPNQPLKGTGKGEDADAGEPTIPSFADPAGVTGDTKVRRDMVASFHADRGIVLCGHVWGIRGRAAGSGACS